jgi:hypothetical protein
MKPLGKQAVVTAVVLAWLLPVFASPVTIDANLMNGSGFDVSLAVDGKEAVTCKDGGMCSFKIARGAHKFRAQLSNGEVVESSFTIPEKWKMACIFINPKKAFDYSDCGQ